MLVCFSRHYSHEPLRLRGSEAVRIALFGATSPVGRCITAEAERRVHSLTAVFSHSSFAPADLAFTVGDLSDPASVARALREWRDPLVIITLGRGRGWGGRASGGVRGA